MGDTIAQTRSENVSKHSNGPLLARGNTLQSGEDSLKLQELMELCTNLQQRVLALETTKTTQANEMDSLKRKVKKLEKKDKKRTYKLKRLYKVGLSARVVSFEDEGLGEEDASKQGRIANAGITLDSTHFDVDTDMFGVHDLDGDEVIVESVNVVKTAKETFNVVATTVSAATITEVDITLAQALAELKSAKPKATKQSSQDKIDVDYQLAQRLQAQEQEELTDAEKARLFVQFLKQRRKQFTAKRAEEKRNRPPTKAQQRSIMCTYLKNMEGWKPKSLNSKSFANIQELFDKAFKMVNTFVDYKTELVEESSKKAEVMEESSKKVEAEIVQESSSKRAGEELEQESSKKQKVEEDKESEELKKCLEIVLDDRDDVTIKATPLSIKYPTIMLKNFNIEDLEVLWSIVKARFKKTNPVNYMDNFLLLNLKTMFKHHVEDSIWRNQQGLVKVLNWKLFYSCRVHCVIVQSIPYYLLVKKMYPLIKHTLHQIFNDVKLQVDYECEMAFELLRLVKKQLKEGYMSLNEVFGSILLVINEAFNEET
ncbi:hypothetical protein Tco_0568271 [Tanacetum coccineum]